MPDDRPINRCLEKGCPCIGRFSSGYCPMHHADPPARIPTLQEAWATDDEGG